MPSRAALPMARASRAAGSPLFAVTVALALLSVGLFGYGVFLHSATKQPVLTAAHAKPLPHAKHKRSPAAGKGKNALAQVSSPIPSTPDLAFNAMLGGGLGLLLSALAGLGLIRRLWATQAQTVQAMLQTEHAAWEKQRGVLGTQHDALSAQLREAQQNKAEIDALRQHASRQFQEFFRTLPVACFCFAADGKIVRWNAACETLYGIPAVDALDSSIWETIIPAEERSAMTAWMDRVLAGESVLDVERQDQNIGGALFPVRCSLVPLHGADGEIIGGLSAGIDRSETTQYEAQIATLGTELQLSSAALEATQAEIAQLQAAQAEKANEANIPAVSARDAVTGLCNQNEFYECLREEAERAHRYNMPLSVVVFDLDGFGAYNQTLGFESGDAALKSVASLILTKIRTVDTAARCNADTFALVLPETSEAGTRIAADRLRAGITGLEWQQKPLTACFGLAQLTPEMASSEALFTHALDSLRRAKSLGPNNVVFHGELPFPTPRKSRRKEAPVEAAA